MSARSLIVTSNKPFSAWGEIFGDEITAAAMIDRLVHHAEILSLKGDSYRLKDRDLARRHPTPNEPRRGRSDSARPTGSPPSRPPRSHQVAALQPAPSPGGSFSTGAKGSNSSGLDSVGRKPRIVSLAHSAVRHIVTDNRCHPSPLPHSDLTLSGTCAPADGVWFS